MIHSVYKTNKHHYRVTIEVPGGPMHGFPRNFHGFFRENSTKNPRSSVNFTVSEQQFGCGVLHGARVAPTLRRGGARWRLPKGLRRAEVTQQRPGEICT